MHYGNIKIAQYKHGRTSERKEYELQPDGTHTLYIVKYEYEESDDEYGDEIEKREVSKGHKMT